jgi:hypothetical protein
LGAVVLVEPDEPELDPADEPLPLDTEELVDEPEPLLSFELDAPLLLSDDVFASLEALPSVDGLLSVDFADAAAGFFSLRLSLR